MTETAPGSIDSEVEMSSSPDAPSSTAEAAEQTNPTAETSDSPSRRTARVRAGPRGRADCAGTRNRARARCEHTDTGGHG